MTICCNFTTYEYSASVSVDTDPSGELKAGTGATVWDSSLVLLKYLEQQYQKATSQSEGLRILDIGSGTGIVGIALASLLPNSKVVCTDKANVMPLLKHNILKSNLSNIEAVLLDWQDKSTAINFMNAMTKFDIVVMSDTITWPELYDGLVETLNTVCDSQTKLIFSHESRNFGVEAGFYGSPSHTYVISPDLLCVA